jgi:hypothetical protein
MLEATTNPNARTAMQRAHEERAIAMAAAWNWLFRSSSR